MPAPVTEAARDGVVQGDGYLFFLSYARSDRAGPDRWVRWFFDDLSAAVGRSAGSSRPGQRVGFLDDGVPIPGGDAVTSALAHAQVFVALYSDRYLRDVRALGERSAFRTRLERLPARQRFGHVVAVLWEPSVDANPTPEFTEARAIAEHVPEYVDCGLGGLRRHLPRFRAAYDEVVGGLGETIARAAASSPLGPGVLDEEDRRTAVPFGADFVIGVLAPTQGRLPSGRSGDCYGTTPTDWRPYGGEPIGARAAMYVRSGFFPRVAATESGFARGPGVLLIDPWIAALPGGREQLARTLADLPRWVMPVVVVDETDPQYIDRGRRLGEEATRLCNAGRRTLLTERAVHEAVAFEAVLGYWIQQAIVRFRRYGPAVDPLASDPRVDAV